MLLSLWLVTLAPSSWLFRLLLPAAANRAVRGNFGSVRLAAWALVCQGLLSRFGFAVSSTLSHTYEVFPSGLLLPLLLLACCALLLRLTFTAATTATAALTRIRSSLKQLFQ